MRREELGKTLAYIILMVVLIIAGLLSRKIHFLPAETGDALWAMTLFCFIKLVWHKANLRKVALATLFIAYAVEFSQLIRWEWLNNLRSTTIGHLLLGQGFLWVDLLAYTIGVGAMVILAIGLRELEVRNQE